MKKLIQDKNGFTLIELMVVVAIMAVLAAMVLGGVTGTGTAGEKAQVLTDASTLKGAVTNYNNSAINQSWPTLAIASTTAVVTFPAEAFNFLETAEQGVRDIPSSRFLNTISSPLTMSDFEVINWKAVTNVRQNTGNVMPAKLVPDFLDAPPDSTRLLSDDLDNNSKKLPEYIWLVKKGSALNADARSVQVWHLDDTEGVAAANKTYIRIYPKVQ